MASLESVAIGKVARVSDVAGADSTSL